ncbi:MAG: hypothetical protein HYU67_08295 [Flavobacteriia bacterium]|nr:hypothetical protein [Flavobacteriia bacterium]
MENEYVKDSASIKDAYNKNNKNKNTEKQTHKREKSGQSLLILQFINGDILRKDIVVNNLPFIFFLIFLCVLLVSKVYYGKQLTQELDVSQKKLNAISAEYIESKARLEEKTKRYELVKTLNPLGLKETTKPVKVIRIKKEK